MRLFGMVILAFGMLSGTVLEAGPVQSSIRPKPRAALVSAATRRPSVDVFYSAEIRPRPRNSVVARNGYDDAAVVAAAAGIRTAVLPAVGVAPAVGLLPLFSIATSADAAAIADHAYQLATAPPVYRSLRPAVRPAGLAARARTNADRQPVRVASISPVVVGRRGAVCGDPKIRGEVLAAIPGRVSGCGVENPVKITSVDGVALSQASIMDCVTAKTLRGWVTDSLKPTIRNRGRGVAGLKVAAHYSCRTRSNKKGAKISEHGKGRAIDIAAIELKDGSSITVLDGWKNRRDRKILERLHQTACGPFGTVLGPESDRYHKDHFHFDTARYRGGAYCR